MGVYSIKVGRLFETPELGLTVARETTRNFNNDWLIFIYIFIYSAFVRIQNSEIGSFVYLVFRKTGGPRYSRFWYWLFMNGKKRK